MTRQFSLDSFAKFLEAQTARHPEVLELATGAAAGILHHKAHDIYGDSSKLVDLAPATQDERERLGYTPNDPLLRDGKLLRDSIEEHHDIMFAAIGTSEPIAVVHEFGDEHIPARPVYKLALDESELEVIAMISQAFQTALGVHHVTSRVLRDVDHRATDAAVGSMFEQFETFSGPEFDGIE